MDSLAQGQAGPLKPPGHFTISQHLWETMQAHVSQEVNEEQCGLVAGVCANDIYQACAVFAITNALHSPVQFRMAADEQIRCFFEIERLGWQLIAIYHSHPGGPSFPSSTDLAEARYPEALNLIWSVENSQWCCRAFYIQNGQHWEIPLQILPLDQA